MNYILGYDISCYSCPNLSQFIEKHSNGKTIVMNKWKNEICKVMVCSAGQV
jgi:hypothetical protein